VNQNDSQMTVLGQTIARKYLLSGWNARGKMYRETPSFAASFRWIAPHDRANSGGGHAPACQNCERSYDPDTATCLDWGNRKNHPIDDPL
jgi:hypothetical protein